MELAEKQRRTAHVSIELSNMQAELAELDSLAVSKRHQLDTVATLLVSHQRELDYESQRRAISAEEHALLEVARSRMKRAVEDEVAAEKAQLLASKMALARQEVEQAAAAEKAMAPTHSSSGAADAGAPGAGKAEAPTMASAAPPDASDRAAALAKSLANSGDLTQAAAAVAAAVTAAAGAQGQQGGPRYSVDPLLQKSLELLLHQVRAHSLTACRRRTSECGVCACPPHRDLLACCPPESSAGHGQRRRQPRAAPLRPQLRGRHRPAPAPAATGRAARQRRRRRRPGRWRRRQRGHQPGQPAAGAGLAEQP